MKPIIEIVETVLWTGWVKGHKPCSLIIIAPPEEGKTTILQATKYARGIIYISDVTLYGLANKIIEHQNKGEVVNHIVIPDFINPLSRQRSVSESLITFLNSLIEEGIAKVKTGSIIVEYPMQAGLITSITVDQWKKYKNKWLSIGFISRLIPVTYRYSRQQIIKVLEFLTGLNKDVEVDLNLDFPEKKVDIELPENIHTIFRPLALQIAAQIKVDGIRLYRDFGIMLKAIALKNGRTKVKMEDADLLLELSDYINYEFRPI